MQKKIQKTQNQIHKITSQKEKRGKSSLED